MKTNALERLLLWPCHLQTVSTTHSFTAAVMEVGITNIYVTSVSLPPYKEAGSEKPHEEITEWKDCDSVVS